MATTGSESVRLHLSGRGRAQAQEIASGLDDHALQSQAQPEVGTRAPRPSAEHQLCPRSHARRNLLGTTIASTPARARWAPQASRRCRRPPADIDAGVVARSRRDGRLGDGQVRVGAVDRAQAPPRGGGCLGAWTRSSRLFTRSSRRRGRSGPVAGRDDVQATPTRGDRRDLVDAGGILALDDGVAVNVAHECHLPLMPSGRGRSVRRTRASGSRCCAVGHRVLGGVWF